MVSEDKFAALEWAYKAFASAYKKHKRQVAKRDEMSLKTHTIRRIQNAEAKLGWSAMELDKLEHFLHVAIVEAGICRAHEPDRYGIVDYHPSAFHHYQFEKKAPFTGE